MSVALDAITDIQEALDEYGSTITLNIPSNSTYNPATGEYTATTANEALKAFIKRVDADNITKNANELYVGDIEFMFYTTTAFTEEATITFNSKEYKILGKTFKFLQDNVLAYEVIGRA